MSKYLYNGIELPSLPDWCYKYVLIRKFVNTSGELKGYFLYSFNELPTTWTEEVKLIGGLTVTNTYHGIQTAVDYRADQIGLNAEAWHDLGDNLEGTNTFKWEIDTVVWANYDVLNADGSVYIAADHYFDEPEQPEPTTAPVIPYLPNNGAWVKHDIYKQVGNTWVKQPQGAVEVEGGAWSALS